jgi:bisphosphoglycerate-dependent phosphoglycerate mutase
MYNTIHEYRKIQGLRKNMQNKKYCKHIIKVKSRGFSVKRKERGG